MGNDGIEAAIGGIFVFILVGQKFSQPRRALTDVECWSLVDVECRFMMNIRIWETVCLAVLLIRVVGRQKLGLQGRGFLE